MDHRDQTTNNRATTDYELYPLITGAERLAIFQEACGIFGVTAASLGKFTVEGMHKKSSFWAGLERARK